MILKLNINKVFLFSLIVFLCTISSSVFSQNWQWFTSAGGDKSDKGIDIDMDRFGNLYVCGYYNNSSSGNVMFSSIAAPVDFGKDAFVAKIDSLGNWIWMQPGQGGWDERALGMCVDKVNSCIYVTGTCWYNTNFGSCPVPASFPGGRDNIFISKLDLNGNCQWLIEAGSAYDDHGYDLVTDKAGNVYVTGFISSDPFSTNDTAYFGIHKLTVPADDSLGFVAKLSPAGVFQWAKSFPGIDGERDNRIAIDDDANIYITGSFYGTQLYGSTSVTSKGGHDIFVLKLDSAGNQIWVQTAGGVLDDRGNSLTVDTKQDVYVAGEFRDIVVFGTDTVNNYGGPNGRDIFVAKITNNGNWKWASKAGSTNGSDRGNRIESNKRDLLFLTGQIKGSATFGSFSVITNPLDSVQAFVAVLDTSGKWQWAIEGGGNYEDRGNGLTVDQFCRAYVTGYFQDTVKFGLLSDTAVNKKDIFVTRIASECNIAGVGIDDNSLTGNVILYPNPFTDKFNIQFDRYYDMMTIEVYDILGQKLQTRQISSVNTVEISISESSGIYFVKLTGKNGLSRTFKAIKE